MDIFLQKEGSHITLEYEGSVVELLGKLGVNPETVLVVKDGELVGLDEEIGDAKRIELLSVISGG